MAVSVVDKKYLQIVNDILESEDFQKLEEIEHHGITRYEHSLKVSYYAYKISKFLRLDYKSTARGGLLHDFFLSPNDKTSMESIHLTFTHPKMARDNAHYLFMTNIKEDDIIISHMFPFYKSFPKYAESWIVNLTDKVIGTNEFMHKFNFKMSYATNLALLFIINHIK